jgi:hypothetical protein
VNKVNKTASKRTKKRENDESAQSRARARSELGLFAF